jgi:hypothetical protein
MIIANAKACHHSCEKNEKRSEQRLSTTSKLDEDKFYLFQNRLKMNNGK